MTKKTATLPPWYKQLWPWVLIGVPLAAIIVSGVLIYFAVTTKDTLVSDHYYKDGLAINEVLDLEQKAKDLGLSIQLNISQEKPVVARLHFKNRSNKSPIPFLKIKFNHPTLANRDHSFKLLPDASGAFSSTNAANMSGHWFVEVTPSDNSWRVKGEIILPSSTSITLSPR